MTVNFFFVCPLGIMQIFLPADHIMGNVVCVCTHRWIS